ncbi:hypothetical protein SAMN05421824_0492 [Hyunsoonleella jejuensis]|uniref:Uncharacterized protein n=1 Tax=Hyunsoonleella jejuensis TaxID=419940 RepID=A0A1H9BAH7_9FLAO|nr:hypothetical protein [Hyunsoonleella jejuensis]SEP85258.1 hypothetical protein SAMN05421824_0492 [Hyunsoonleella jejuensis]
MLRNTIAILLVSIFMLIVVTPTVMILIDDDIDVSEIYAASEEEKEKSQEKNGEKDFIVLEIQHPLSARIMSFEENNLEYCLKMYKKPHIQLSFPPPKKT